MKDKLISIAKSSALVACVAGGAVTQTALASEGLQWNGFFTGAYSISDNEHPYGRFYGITDSGSYLTDTRLGLQGSARINDRVSLVTQLVAKNNNDNFEVNANWLFAKVAVMPGFSVKLGRMQQPVYLFSSQLEAGFTIPWVRPPQEVYEQQFFNDYTGVDIQLQSYFAGHDVTLSVIHGVQNNEITSSTLGSLFALDNPVGQTQSSDNYRGMVLQLEGDFYRLKFAAVRQDLSVQVDKVAVNGFKIDVVECEAALPTVTPECENITFTKSRLGNGGDVSVNADFWTLGFDASQYGARVVGEYAVRTVDEFDREGYYLSFMYQVEDVTPYFTYASHDTTGKNVLDHQVQDSTAVGVRYDWLPGTALKLEILQVNPKGETRGLYHIGFVQDSMKSMTAATLALDLAF